MEHEEKKMKDLIVKDPFYNYKTVGYPKRKF